MQGNRTSGMTHRRGRNQRWHVIFLIGTILAFNSLFGNANVSAEALDPQPCHSEKSQSVSFTGAENADRIYVRVSGSPCSQAIVTIILSDTSGREVYRYDGNFIEHMPYLIYEPELNKLVDFFVNKVIAGAVQRFTNDLPAYTGVDSFYESTNDFVVVPINEYEQLRQQKMPLLWHATGESTWVHVVYNPDTQISRVIMRGGVFQ